jgi:hypothetical protein
MTSIAEACRTSSPSLGDFPKLLRQEGVCEVARREEMRAGGDHGMASLMCML